MGIKVGVQLGDVSGWVNKRKGIGVKVVLNYANMMTVRESRTPEDMLVRTEHGSIPDDDLLVDFLHHNVHPEVIFGGDETVEIHLEGFEPVIIDFRTGEPPLDQYVAVPAYVSPRQENRWPFIFVMLMLVGCVCGIAIWRFIHTMPT